MINDLKTLEISVKMKKRNLWMINLVDYQKMVNQKKLTLNEVMILMVYTLLLCEKKNQFILK